MTRTFLAVIPCESESYTRALGERLWKAARWHALAVCCSLQETLADVVWWSVVCGLHERQSVVILYTLCVLTSMLVMSTFEAPETKAISIWLICIHSSALQAKSSKLSWSDYCLFACPLDDFLNVIINKSVSRQSLHHLYLMQLVLCLSGLNVMPPILGSLSWHYKPSGSDGICCNSQHDRNW